MKRILFLKELIAILEATQPVAGAVALDLEAYDEPPPPQRSRIGHPYCFCGALLLTRLSIMLRRDLKTAGTVTYTFESGDNGAGELRNAVASLSAEARRFLKVDSFGYADKDAFAGLQAADIIAYETAKAALRDLGADRRPPRKSLVAITRICPGAGYLFGKDLLSRWVSENRGRFGFGESNSH
jgi:hypothetical protein